MQNTRRQNTYACVRGSYFSTHNTFILWIVVGFCFVGRVLFGGGILAWFGNCK